MPEPSMVIGTMIAFGASALLKKR
ncbi:MAG: PEP-CTERM sorting domain-containing protein [Leptolyngbyaceae cyanobacterium]